jgi:hypothetical protein
MATLVFMDFETQSEADLTITGGLKYALDTTTRALLLSWAISNDSELCRVCGKPLPHHPDHFLP